MKPDKVSPVSDLLRPEEIDEMMDLSDPEDFDLESDELWFARAEVGGVTYVVSRYGFCCDSDVKGSTFCAGIAPMGDVYLCLGTMHPANFEPSEAVHKMVRQKLGLPLEGPLDLSTADQARFAEETIRRIDALGKFKHVGYGGS